MIWSHPYFNAACVVSLKMIVQRNNEENRTSGSCQDVSVESFGVRKTRVSNLHREVKTSRNQGTMTMKLGDPDKDIGRTF
jgi:hypothetical protein